MLPPPTAHVTDADLDRLWLEVNGEPEPDVPPSPEQRAALLDALSEAVKALPR